MSYLDDEPYMSEAEKRLLKVEGIAKDIHKDDLYGTQPYSVHLDAVSAKCVELMKTFKMLQYSGLWYDVRACAYLHDAIEDHPECIGKLVSEVGLDIVNCLEVLNKNNYRSTQPYLEACASTQITFMVKLADQMCNQEASLKEGNYNRAAYYSERIAKLLEYRGRIV